MMYVTYSDQAGLILSFFAPGDLIIACFCLLLGEDVGEDFLDPGFVACDCLETFELLE